MMRRVRRASVRILRQMGRALLRLPSSPRLLHRLLLSDAERRLPHAPEWRFLGMVVQHGHRSRAQLFQDLWVLFELGEKRGGFFVEFGAADGVYLSNTYLLEKEYGWHGVLAEPLPVWHEALRRNRSAQLAFKCVGAESGKTVTLAVPRSGAEYATAEEHMSDSPHFGGVSEWTQEVVESVSLVDLLDEAGAPRDIDYISIDVEGAEFDVLEAFDFSAYRVALFTIEHNGRQRETALDAFMEERGYERVFRDFSIFDAWYRRRR